MQANSRSTLTPMLSTTSSTTSGATSASHLSTSTLGTISLITQSPSNYSLYDESSGIKSGLSTTNSTNSGIVNSNSCLLSSQQPKRQRSCDIIDSRAIILAKSNKQSPNLLQAQQATKSYITNTSSLPVGNLSTNSYFNFANVNMLSPLSSASNVNVSNTNKLQKSPTIQNQQMLSSLQKTDSQTTSTSSSNNNGGGELNVLLDPIIINDYPTQALLLTLLATLVRNSTDESEIRILYQYIAEASIVFPKVFPVIHNLLDSKINHILQLSLDESILNSVQSIIHNMISTCELIESNQQQLSYLQSCGFGGLWRFAQPFAIGREKPENAELFVDCLEAMVETCLPQDYDNFSCESNSNLTNISANNNFANNNNSYRLNVETSSNSNLNQSNNMRHLSSISNIMTGSMSSMGRISMGSIPSPTDREINEFNELSRSNRNRRNSSPKDLV
jgi:hypothetical protein